MIPPQTPILPLAAAAVFLSVADRAQAATLAVDWLEFRTGPTATQFTLVDDTAAPAVSGSVNITAGILFPGFPTARVLQDPFWVTNPDVVDTQSADQTVRTSEIRVVPSSGRAAYSITFTVPAGKPIILAIGDMFRGTSGTTSGVRIAATADGVPGTIGLLESHAWNNGSKALTQTVTWNAVSQFLANDSGVNGESLVAFLKIDPLGGTNNLVTLTFDDATAPSPAGDSVQFALGIIPEPVSMTLMGGGLIVLSMIRRRR